VLISFCDAGKHTVGMCISRLAKELSAKDAKGNVIPETEVTVSRLSRLIEEQVRFGVLGLAEERTWDRESRLAANVCLYHPRGIPDAGRRYGQAV
jgi:hypothetical protein